ncbi:hypothetical protein HMPREF0658_0950, partial [Hoylesella marshii DSM 16973 = JCM 13450]
VGQLIVKSWATRWKKLANYLRKVGQLFMQSRPTIFYKSGKYEQTVEQLPF